ncbi:MAG: hypothetical protein F7C07_02450 [Desulfurococcales archaeon]|nr:hypothetical protein [Desulfurococcales archaeon]
MRNLREWLSQVLGRESLEERLKSKAILLSPSELEEEIAAAVESMARKGVLRPGSIAPFYGSICALEMVVSALERISQGDKRLRLKLLRAPFILDILSSLKHRLYAGSHSEYMAALDSLIEPGSVVLVHGYGDLLASALASMKYKLEKVWSLEIEPLGIGRKLAHYLKREGVEAGYATSPAKNSLVRASDIVLARVYSSTLDGLLVSDPGVYGLKRLAQIHEKPVYLFSEDLGLLGCASSKSIEEFKIKASSKPPALILPAFEAVEYQGFTGLIYEGGLARSGIRELMVIYRKRVQALVDDEIRKKLPR